MHDGALVTRRRSSYDGRDVFYAVDLASCRNQFEASALALHPGLWPNEQRVDRARGRKERVLYLCTGNSARSQIAEALTVHLSNGAVTAASAGSAPKPVHPNAVRVLRERGIDISGSTSKHLDRFRTRRLDRVITLCDRVREVCPEFPAAPSRAHWSIPDPALEGTSDRASYPAFERTADELETRITYLLATRAH